jgi:DNA-binding transcriptional LysR family regulator
LKQVDLNLFVIFDTIMREQSITAAAEQLAMTQPSVSNAVSRMRHAWNDPLFVKAGRGIKPTPMADHLWQQIGVPLTQITEAANHYKFNAATAKRTFRIALTDFAVNVLWQPLRAVIEKEANGINIHAIPYAVNASRLLKNAEADIIIDISPGSDPALSATKLFDNDYVCAMSHQHPLAGKEITMDRFIAADHLLVSLSGEASGAVDDILAKQGLKRRIACTVNHFSCIPKMLTNSELITIIPRPIIDHAINVKNLYITPPPFQISPAPISMIWHQRNDRDLGVKWLRENIEKIVKAEIENLNHQH